MIQYLVSQTKLTNFNHHLSKQVLNQSNTMIIMILYKSISLLCIYAFIIRSYLRLKDSKFITWDTTYSTKDREKEIYYMAMELWYLVIRLLLKLSGKMDSNKEEAII